MAKFISFLAILVCLFGPMTLFTVVGHQALEALGRRPSEGAKVMIPFIIKVMIASLLSLGILMIILKVFGPSDKPGDYVYKDFEWVKAVK